MGDIMPSPTNSPSPRRAGRSRLTRLCAAALLAFVCGGRAGADTITMQDAQKDTKQAEKVRERVLERIAEGAASGVECVEPGLQLPLKKELLIPTGIIIVTTVLIFDPEPEPPGPSVHDPDPAQSIPEPAALLLLATGLGYARLKLRQRKS
jgi:hypothetical protein